MNERLEGTLVLDGLIEGKLPDRPDAKALLGEWIAAAAGAKLRFHLEIDGESFNLLADKRPIEAAELGPAPADAIAEALGELLKIFPPGAPGEVLSTLRSVEFRPGREVQTLYAVGAGGRIEARQRTVDAKTTPRPEPMTGRQKLRLALVGVLVALLVLAVSAIFVDYRALFGRIFEQIAPFDAEAVAVNAPAFGGYFAVEKKASARGGSALVLTLKRGKDFPTKAADYDRLLKRAGESLPDRLAVEALARGYVRCECFDKKGKFLDWSVHRVSGLRKNETIELTLTFARDRRPGRVDIIY